MPSVRHALEDVLPPAPHAPQPPHQRNGSLGKAQRRVRDEQVPIEAVTRAKPVAVGTHPLRIVEAE